MCGMDDLVTFLRARLDDRERAAPTAHVDPDEGGFYACPATRDEPFGDLPYGPDACECRLAERRADVLDDVDSKRRILDDIAGYADPDHPGSEGAETDGLAWRTLRNLALPFTGHRDYRPGWAPEAT
jgi:hypothetical protein